MTYETLNYEGPVKLVDVRKTGTITPLDDVSLHSMKNKIPEYLQKNYFPRHTLYEFGKIHDFEKMGLVKRTTEKPIVVYGLTCYDDGSFGEDDIRTIVGLPTPYQGGIVVDGKVYSAYVIKTEDLEDKMKKIIFEFVFGLDEATIEDTHDFTPTWYIEELEKRGISDESAFNNHHLREYFLTSSTLQDPRSSLLVSEKESEIKKSFGNAFELLQYLGYNTDHLIFEDFDDRM